MLHLFWIDGQSCWIPRLFKGFRSRDTCQSKFDGAVGVDHDEVTGPSGEGVAQVVKSASGLMIAVGAMATARAGPPLAISALAADLGLGQVLDAGDALGGIGAVFAGSRHGETPGRNGSTRNYDL